MEYTYTYIPIHIYYTLIQILTWLIPLTPHVIENVCLFVWRSIIPPNLPGESSGYFVDRRSLVTAVYVCICQNRLLQFAKCVYYYLCIVFFCIWLCKNVFAKPLWKLWKPILNAHFVVVIKITASRSIIFIENTCSYFPLLHICITFPLLDNLRAAAQNI